MQKKIAGFNFDTDIKIDSEGAYSENKFRKEIFTKLFDDAIRTMNEKTSHNLDKINDPKKANYSPKFDLIYRLLSIAFNVFKLRRNLIKDLVEQGCYQEAYNNLKDWLEKGLVKEYDKAIFLILGKILELEQNGKLSEELTEKEKEDLKLHKQGDTINRIIRKIIKRNFSEAKELNDKLLENAEQKNLLAILLEEIINKIEALAPQTEASVKEVEEPTDEKLKEILEEAKGWYDFVTPYMSGNKVDIKDAISNAGIIDEETKQLVILYEAMELYKKGNKKEADAYLEEISNKPNVSERVKKFVEYLNSEGFKEKIKGILKLEKVTT